MKELARMYQSDGQLQHTLSTFQMTLLGFIIGSALGAVLGFMLGSSPFLKQVVSPYILALQNSES